MKQSQSKKRANVSRIVNLITPPMEENRSHIPRSLYIESSKPNSAQIEYSRPWKVLENPHFICCSSFQNLRLGGVKCAIFVRYMDYWQLNSAYVLEYRLPVPFQVNFVGHVDVTVPLTSYSVLFLPCLVHCPDTSNVLLPLSFRLMYELMVEQSLFSILSLPNEDFGRRNKRWNPDFRITFQGREYSIWATNWWKVSRTSGFHLLFLLPKSSFGEHKFLFLLSVQFFHDEPLSVQCFHDEPLSVHLRQNPVACALLFI